MLVDNYIILKYPLTIPRPIYYNAKLLPMINPLGAAIGLFIITLFITEVGIPLQLPLVT